MDESLLKEILGDLARAELAREYGKDMRNEFELRLIAEGRFDEYQSVKRGDWNPPRL